MKKVCAILCLVMLWGCFAPLHAQSQRKTRILFILDYSLSMDGKFGNARRMDVAKKLLGRLIDSLKTEENVEMALRAYGHRSPTREQDCTDTRLEVGFEPENTEKILAAINKYEPRGTTPIAYSLGKAALDFPDSKSQNIIVLITDGGEECQGNPCKVSLELQSKGVILRPFIVGIGLTDAVLKTFECVGKYYNAKTEEDLKEVLTLVISQALNTTTVQVNLNDHAGKPKETDVNMTFLQSKAGTVDGNFYHTMNSLERPDTFKLDPSVRYDLRVNTTPPVFKKGIDLKPGKHNIIDVDAPQGTLAYSIKTYEGAPAPPCLVREAGRSEILFSQDGNTAHRYIAGTYDLEILTLPRIYHKTYQVQGGQQHKLDVPQPGKLDLTYGKESEGAVFVRSGDADVWVMNLAGAGKQILNLQPGEYNIIYHARDAKETTQTYSREVKIQSGATTSITIK